jgi:uncharacterized protein involved in cysteine biosynthesis
MTAQMDWTYIAILVIANIPLYLAVAWVFFDNLEGFTETLKYALKPDIISWIQGEGPEDMWHELKLAGFIAMCILLVYAEHWLLQKYIFN